MIFAAAGFGKWYGHNEKDEKRIDRLLSIRFFEL
jgi:hypothetical protein